MRCATWMSLLVGLGGCGGSVAEIITPRDVPRASGAPDIKKVTDLGDLDLATIQGKVPLDASDGSFVVGELILVAGSDFGKLPTVLVGGRPAEAMARTTGGGIITRIPAGVPAGRIEVEVSHPRGKGARAIDVRRYGIVADTFGNRLLLVDVGRKSASVTKESLAVDNPREVRFAPDGAYAYVASGVATGPQGSPDAQGKLSVVALSAKGGPRVVHDIPTKSRFVTSLAVAEETPLLAVLGEEHLELFSLKDPRHPAPYQPLGLPPEIRQAGIVSADLDPRGKVMALLLATGNRVVLVDVQNPQAPRVAQQLDVLPGERLPLVKDLRFSVDGETLWVLSGETARSYKAGNAPTRLSTIRLSDGQLAVVKTAPVAGARAPVALSAARGQPVASGTTIRQPPEKAALFLTTVDPRLLPLADVDPGSAAGKQKMQSLLSRATQPGTLVRTNIEGAGGPLFTTPTILSALHVSPDTQMLLAVSARPGQDGSAGELVLSIAPLWGNASPEHVTLGPLPPEELRPPFQFAHIRIQP